MISLQMQIQQQDEAIREAERLRAFLDLSNPASERLVAARVIGRDPSRSLQTVTIDKGTSSGVKLNASVITPTVLSVESSASRRASAVVQLITDAQSEVGGHAARDPAFRPYSKVPEAVISNWTTSTTTEELPSAMK